MKVDFSKTAVKFADILLPSSRIDLTKWATVACDQFSSEIEYWQEVEKIVSTSPSTYRITLPECYLEKDNSKRISAINSAMDEYLNSGVFVEYKNSIILTKRSNTNNVFRYGIVVALDLEEYSFEKDSKSLIRATEGTILERIPPRVEIRKNAPLETPHIMVMIDDEKRNIIEPLSLQTDTFKKIYDVELMMNGGRLEGWLINDAKVLEKLKTAFIDLYESSPKDKNGNKLLFAVGDGNHSLATAKQCWQDIKPTLSKDELLAHPSRYCLVEIENIYDPGIIFEPIHRVLFSIDIKNFDAELSSIVGQFTKTPCKDSAQCVKEINKDKTACYFAIYYANEYFVYKINKKGVLSTSAKIIEALIDSVVYQKHIATVDYIHEVEDTIKVAKNADKKAGKFNNIAIIMSEIKKEEFFPTILNVGTFPRKTFSLGSAVEKRYYMECRKIIP